MLATEIIRKFKAEGEKCLTKKDIAFCHELIKSGVVGIARVEAVSAYILDEKRGELMREGIDAAERFGNYFENYLSISQGLLFSHTGKKPSNAYYHYAPDDFKSVIVVLPEQKILIKAENYENDAWYGERKDRAGKLIVVKVYTYESGVWHLFYDGSFIDPYYPRYSMYCLNSHRCDKYNPRQMHILLPESLHAGKCDSSTFKTECFLGRYGSQSCPREVASMKAYELNLHDYYAIAVESFERWKQRPIRSGTQKTEKYNDYGVCALTVETPPDGNLRKQEFKEVRLKEYYEYATSRRLMGWTVENRLSPCEHERREHTRTLKSGKVVNVRSATVNKGNGKAVYKID